VSAAVLVESGRVLVSLRLPDDGRHADLWEFPGGTLEPGETAEEALVREIREELDLSIVAGTLYERVIYEDGNTRIDVRFFRVARVSGEPRALEVAKWEWAGPARLRELEFLPSNRAVRDRLADELRD